MLSLSEDRREPAIHRQFCNFLSTRIKNGAPHQHNDCFSLPLACGPECTLKVLGTQHVEVLKLYPQRSAASSVSFSPCALPTQLEVPKKATRESLGSTS